MAVLSRDLALRALQHRLTPDKIITDPVSLITYNGDAGLDRGQPEGVVFAHSVADVVHIAQWASEHHIPLVARGAGTGLSGGAVAEHGGIIVEFARMEHILDLDERSGSATVQPGAVTLHLEDLVKTRGWYYPPDPSSGRAATLGGNIAENSGGPHCFKYGVTANYVQELEAVLPDGRRKRFGGPAFDYPEFDMVGLLTGSEGTLALITQARLRLIRLPPAVKTLIAAFDSIEAAGNAVSDIIARGLVPATMEMMDQSFLRIIEDFSHAGWPTEAGAALIIDVDGYPQSVDPQMDEIAAILREHLAFDLHIAQTAEQRQKIWYGRKSAAGAIARLARMFYLVDVTVPRSKLAVMLTEVTRICTSLNLRVVYVLHAGDGNLHPMILIDDMKDRDQLNRVLEAGHQIVEVCIGHGGSITGEHGVGIEKRAHMPHMYTPAELQAMHDIKEIFDPHHLLNPQKIFPPDMTPPEPLPAPAPPMPAPYAPASTHETAIALQSWYAAGQRVRVVGGGTKSGALPPADVLLSTGALRGIRTYARDDLYVTVGAGTTLAELQAELAADRMWTPLASPWPRATVGGIVATNTNAPQRMRYGGVRDLVLGATVVLPSGPTIRTGRAVVKNVAGYDLPRLFVGSHGTLGIMTDITLKLVPLPRARLSLVLPVSNNKDGATALQRALEWGAHLTRVRLATSALLLCRGTDVAEYLPQVAGAPYVLIHTIEGLPEDVAAERDEAQRVLAQVGAPPPHRADELSGNDIWGEIVRGSSDTSATLLRVGVPPGELATVMLKVMPLLAQVPFVADLISGVLHIQASGDAASQLALLRQAVRDRGGYACAPTQAGNPTLLDVWGYVPDGLDLMRAIKERWDEKGLLNPGAFLV
jgi:D-lactate dehydrogenase (cytochrome)